MRIRNAVTSAKKINPIEIMRDLKSPASSSYISSAKKALIQEQDFDEKDRIHFELSGDRGYPIKSFCNKENMRNNHNIMIEKFDKVSDQPKVTHNELHDYVNATNLQVMEQDYNMLESPEKSHHKHSKSRSRTKEKRGTHSDGDPEN